VDHLKKPQIIFEAERCNLNTSGIVNDIRRRLSQHLDEHLEISGMNPTHTAVGPSPPPALLIPPISPLSSPLPAVLDNGTSHSKAMNQIRKWGCHFDGRDPLSFLERVMELQRQYHFSNKLILDGLPELLRGKALL